MLRFLKNNVFMVLFVGLAAGFTTLAVHTGQREVAKPDIVPVAQPDADGSESGTLTGPHGPEGISGLYNTGASHVSPFYSEGGNWRLAERAFVAIDLDDMIAWHAENHPNADPSLYTRTEILDEFDSYMSFMKSESWLLWLAPRERHNELFSIWQRHWRDISIDRRNKFHGKALKAKKQHLLQYLDGNTIAHEELKRRCADVFTFQRGRLIPLNRTELPNDPSNRISTSSLRRQSSFDDFKDWAVNNIFWAFLTFAGIFFAVYFFFFRLLPMIRD